MDKIELILLELVPDIYNVYKSDSKCNILNLITGGGILLATPTPLNTVVDTFLFEVQLSGIDFLVVKCSNQYETFYLGVVLIPLSVSFDMVNRFLQTIGEYFIYYMKYSPSICQNILLN